MKSKFIDKKMNNDNLIGEHRIQNEKNYLNFQSFLNPEARISSLKQIMSNSSVIKIIIKRKYK